MYGYFHTVRIRITPTVNEYGQGPLNRNDEIVKNSQKMEGTCNFPEIKRLDLPDLESCNDLLDPTDTNAATTRRVM